MITDAASPHPKPTIAVANCRLREKSGFSLVMRSSHHRSQDGIYQIQSQIHTSHGAPASNCKEMHIICLGLDCEMYLLGC